MIECSNPESVQQPTVLRPGAAGGVAPGKLRGDVWLNVQTHHAQRLVTGRPRTADKPAIVGLMGFANRVRVIWNAARADDPYAGWWLIRIEDAMSRAQARLKAEREALAAAFNHESILEIEVAASEKPYRLGLRFASPYAYRGAQLIAGFDATACRILTLKHIGLMDRALAARSLNVCASVIRHVFAATQGYRALGIDREAVLAGCDAAHEAAAAMGDLPEDVLSGVRCAALGPRRRLTEPDAPYGDRVPASNAP